MSTGSEHVVAPPPQIVYTSLTQQDYGLNTERSRRLPVRHLLAPIHRQPFCPRLHYCFIMHAHINPLEGLTL